MYYEVVYEYGSYGAYGAHGAHGAEECVALTYES